LNIEEIEYYVNTKLSSIYTPVPYLLDISLYLLSNKEEDKFSVVELIPPQFIPSLYTTVNYMFGPLLINSPISYKGRVEVKLDEAVTLEGFRSQDLNQLDFNEPNLMITQFDFTMSCSFFKEISHSAIIKKIIFNFGVDNEIVESESQVTDLNLYFNQYFNDDWQSIP
jgi:hypothetical protein